MSASFTDVVNAVEDPYVNTELLKLLGQSAKLSAEKVRGHEIIDVSSIGSYAPKHMIGKQLPYDETKPRASEICNVQNSISNSMIRSSSDIASILNNTTERAGYELGATMNGNCAGCASLNTRIVAQYSMMRDATEVRFSASCKHGGNPVCPDKSWGAYTPGFASMTTAGAMSADMFEREYMQDHSLDAARYMANNGILNVRPSGLGFAPDPSEYIKPKEVVKDSDVEVEIRKLDENYGLF